MRFKRLAEVIYHGKTVSWPSSRQAPGQTRAERMQAFFAAIGVQFVPQPIFLSRRDEHFVARLAARYQQLKQRVSKGYVIEDLRKASQFQILMERSQRFQTFLGQGAHSQIEIVWISSDVEFALVAQDFIPQGAWLGEYAGEYRRVANSNEDYLWDNLVPGCLRETPDDAHLFLDALTYGNEMRFMNHQSVDVMAHYLDGRMATGPNVGFGACFSPSSMHFVFFAKRDIYRGDELRISYGQQYWIDKGVAPKE